jgi:hypothetical protein
MSTRNVSNGREDRGEEEDFADLIKFDQVKQEEGFSCSRPELDDEGGLQASYL